MSVLFLLLSTFCFSQSENKPIYPLLSEKSILLLAGNAQFSAGALDKATQKYLRKLQKEEAKLQKQIAKKDSILAKQLFAGINERYAALTEVPPNLPTQQKAYISRLDSLTTLVKFLKAENGGSDQVSETLAKYEGLQKSLDQTENVRKFLNERKRILQESLEKLGMVRKLRGFSKNAYYYSQQLRDLKMAWANTDKLVNKVLEWISRSEKFKAFFQRNSQLASLFSLPGGGSSATPSLQGLQTRASVQQALISRFGSTPQVQQQIQGNIQFAQAQLSRFGSNLSALRSGGLGNISAIDIPDGFKPNSQRTKTFFRRLEYGANIQSQKSNNLFPVTSDIGLSLGYKLNDKSVIGLGASYKLGWGRGWNNIRLSNEGAGLRSYMDYQLKGSVYISAGYEQNYRTSFDNFQQLKNFSAWQNSGLIGLSKKYKVSAKLKGDMKLLWDFLSYRQIPKTQAVLFRIGYALK